MFVARFTKAAAITPGNCQFQPFDQASSPLTFRTNAYPTVAIVPAEAEGRADSAAWPGDARIVITTSAYKTNVYVNNPPQGVKYQLVVRKVFGNPAPVCAVPGTTAAASVQTFVSVPHNR